MTAVAMWYVHPKDRSPQPAMACRKRTSLLQVGQFSFNQPLPCALPPPLVHALDALPEALLVDVVDIVLAVIDRPAVTLRDFQRRLVLPTAQVGSASRHTMV